MSLSKNGKFTRSRSRWQYPYKNEHPTDKLKIKMLLNEKIKGNRIVGLEARIEAGQVHKMHTHKNEFVIVYCLDGKCLVTVGSTTRTVHPRTLIFIPPRVPHRFYNKFSDPWKGIAFAIGINAKIKNDWLEE